MKIFFWEKTFINTLKKLKEEKIKVKYLVVQSWFLIFIKNVERKIAPLWQSIYLWENF
jgi:hypothetical protein